MSVADVGHHLPTKHFRRVTWREGTKGKLWSRFALCRVLPVRDEAATVGEGEAVWLLLEWPPNEPASTKFWLATLPETITRKQIVRLVKERYRTERVYEDLKGELGLDHFEGRTFGGWHHHVTVALCCFAFIVAERVRRFSPPVPKYRRRE
jgi:SRSO17 transposase